jgi:hypothetical protein
MTSPSDYAVAVFRAYEALQIGADSRDIDAAERALRAVNGTHPLLRELSRKSALVGRRQGEPGREALPSPSPRPDAG